MNDTQKYYTTITNYTQLLLSAPIPLFMMDVELHFKIQRQG